MPKCINLNKFKGILEEADGICMELDKLDTYLDKDINSLKTKTKAPTYEDTLERMEVLRSIMLKKINRVEEILDAVLDVIEDSEKDDEE